MIEARVRDFRIDSRLQRVCGNYLMELCGGMDSYELEDTDLNNCLQVRAGGAYSCWTEQAPTRAHVVVGCAPSMCVCSSSHTGCLHQFCRAADVWSDVGVALAAAHAPKRCAT